MIKERILQILEYKHLVKEIFFSKIGMTSANFRGNAKKSPLNSNAIENILSEFPEINPEWLLTGKGEMLKSDESLKPVAHIFKEDAFQGGSPFYEDLPVSAGKQDAISNSEHPTGYIKIPGITPYAYFPVIGCSFLPRIYPGDIIGVNKIISWEKVDPDKIYLIVTHEDRMIKHLKVDNERTDILWCLSPNYKDFPINKDDIKNIYHVVFSGRLM